MAIDPAKEKGMLKRSPLLAILAAAFALSLFFLSANAGKQARTQSSSDLAKRLWLTSGHADKTAEAFRHWDEEGAVPTSCAKCHSTPGYRDYIGADGSAFNVVDKAAALGTTVECDACHADPATGVVHNHTSVVFPSGVEVKDLGPEALCMECHQGRASTRSVDASIAASAVGDDAPSSKLRFINVHYYASAATQFGTVVRGGYEYAAKTYDARFSHITGYNACQTCHNPHSLEVDLEACHTCHVGVKDPKDIRYLGSLEDYDGDGNLTEGIYYEIETLKGILYDSLRIYARQVLGQPIAYDAATYPYFFNDKNDNGAVDPEEANSANAYARFSPRLLRAAYNFQVSQKDPNSFAHNGKYMIELIYDSIEDLTSSGQSEGTIQAFQRPDPDRLFQATEPDNTDKKRLPAQPGDLSFGVSSTQQIVPSAVHQSGQAGSGALRRTDEGHFDGSSMAFRHWDADGTVPATCAKCHSAEGLPYFLENSAIDKAMPTANGLLCTTCHTSPPHTRFTGPVKFPSGVVKDLGNASNLCLNCHQGRASKKSVDASIAGGPAPYRFTNIHYYPAAASYFGHEVQGGYEFSGKSYTGQNAFNSHLGIFTDCVECHFSTKSFNRKQDDSDDMFHNAAPSKEDCAACHVNDIAQPHPGESSRFEFEGIRPAHTPDYDADGNTSESLEAELDGLEEELYAQLQAYGRSVGRPIAYDEHAYPYFFNDLNNNGIVDPAEADFSNNYQFDAASLRAAYNYQFSKKEPCGYIHNALYLAQLMVDSIGHLGGEVKKFTWR